VRLELDDLSLGRKVGIREADGDLFKGQSQLVADDLRQRSQCPLTHVDAAGEENRRTIGVKTHVADEVVRVVVLLVVTASPCRGPRFVRAGGADCSSLPFHPIARAVRSSIR